MQGGIPAIAAAAAVLWLLKLLLLPTSYSFLRSPSPSLPHYVRHREPFCERRHGGADGCDFTCRRPQQLLALPACERDRFRGKHGFTEEQEKELLRLLQS
ncbi:MAG TPA: hypothetical protein VN512_09705 [Clostridia bacterium]|nr:hypothetical protein [Clostridia bacterium]